MQNLRLVRDTLQDKVGSHLHPVPVAPLEAQDGERIPDHRPALAWRAIVLQAAALWLATRVAFLVLTYFAYILTMRGPGSATVPATPRTLLVSWDRWDTIWFINIARLGYFKAQASAFFPLYPLLIKLTGLVIGPHWLAAALLVSNLATLGAFIGLGLWAAQEDASHRAGARVVRAIAAYPLALFLFAGYSEGLFIGLAAFTLFFARRGGWGWAALTAFLAGLTRATALVLILPLAWEFGRQHDWWRRDRWRVQGGRRTPLRVRDVGLGALVIAAVPLAFACYELYIWRTFHQMDVILRVEHVFWYHTAMSPLDAVTAVVRQFRQAPGWTYWQAHQLLDVVPVVAFALITVVTARRMPLAFTLYTAGVIALAIASPITQGYPDLLVSAGRYMLTAIPVFLTLGRWMGRYAWLDLLLTSGGFMLQGVLVVVLLDGGWLI